MKKLLVASTILSLGLILSGCGEDKIASSQSDNETSDKEEKKQVTALAEIQKHVSTAWKSYDTTYVHSAAIYENKGNVPVEMKETQMNYKATDDSILGTETMIYAVPSVILPGETAIIVETGYLDGVDPEAFAETTYNFSFKETTEDPTLMEVSGIKGIVGEYGYKVTGVLKNITEDQQDDIRIAAALLDAEGNLLGALEGSVDIGLAPNGETGFELSYPDLPPNIQDKIATIEVKPYGWNW
ncbi:FxLYD domain-containing protein [Lysinibacillus sp. FSL K6-0232]|uniref:FxLYD domain-containing protein n=1 Tax=unclassified Lysinibacillus TaxID=2636778 RepID=UPI0030F553B4